MCVWNGSNTLPLMWYTEYRRNITNATPRLVRARPRSAYGHAKGNGIELAIAPRNGDSDASQPGVNG